MTNRIANLLAKIWPLAVLLVMLTPRKCFAEGEGTLKEFRDEKFGYRFFYPADWKLEELPEGNANSGMRLRLGGPGGSSFVVIIERTAQPLSKLEFQADPKAAERVAAMMRKTLEQTYRSISKSLGALSMKTGEKRDLSDDSAIEYYLATLHRMKTGNPVIVAGIHAYPFFKDYSINFLMTAFYRGKAAENQILTAVFNSFRLIDAAVPPKVP